MTKIIHKQLTKQLFKNYIKFLESNQGLSTEDYKEFMSKVDKESLEVPNAKDVNKNKNTNMKYDNFIVFYTGIVNMMTYEQYKRYKKICYKFGEDNVYINMYLLRNDVIPWQFKIKTLSETYNIPLEKISIYNHKNDILGYGDQLMYTQELQNKINDKHMKIVHISDDVTGKNSTNTDYTVIKETDFINDEYNMNVHYIGKDNSLLNSKPEKFLISGWTHTYKEKRTDAFWISVIDLLLDNTIQREEKIEQLYNYFDKNSEVVAKFIKNIEQHLINIYLSSDNFKKLENYDEDLINIVNNDTNKIDLDSIQLYGYQILNYNLSNNNYNTYLDTKNSNVTVNDIYNTLIDMNSKHVIDSNSINYKNKLKNILYKLCIHHGYKMLESIKRNKQQLFEVSDFGESEEEIYIDRTYTNSSTGAQVDDGPIKGGWGASFKYYTKQITNLLKKNNYSWVVTDLDKFYYENEKDILASLVKFWRPVVPFNYGENPTPEQINNWLDILNNTLSTGFKYDGTSQINLVLQTVKQYKYNNTDSNENSIMVTPSEQINNDLNNNNLYNPNSVIE